MFANQQGIAFSSSKLPAGLLDCKKQSGLLDRFERIGAGTGVFQEDHLHVVPNRVTQGA